MSGFSELIKNFDKTRYYVRDFFIYGFKVRNDFRYKSSRTYDDEKRRVESWVGNYLKYDNSQRGKQISISVDSSRISENPLYQAYYAKSFTDNDIKLHFFILDILQEYDLLTLKEIVELLDRRFGEIFDEQTVRNKLREYVEEGVILTQKRGKTACFGISKDTAKELFREIDGLSDAVKFFSETQGFGVIGNSILKSAGLSNDLFYMKHNYIVHALEDEILTYIVGAIKEERKIVIYTFSSRRSFSENCTESENCVVPMQVLSSVQTGRRYLVAYIPDYKRFNAFRLDGIRRVKVGEKVAEYELIYEKYVKNSKRCFGVSFGSRQETGNVEPLKITFYIDEENEGFVIRRLQREKRNGTLERAAKNIFVLTEDLFDPNEAMHWVKSFIGRILKLEGGSEAVRRQFYDDVKRMYAMYCKKDEDGNGEVEENEDIQ